MPSADTLLRKAWLVIEEFRRIDPEIPTQMVSVFLCVALKPGAIAQEIADQIATTLSSVARLADTLSVDTIKGRVGYGLLEKRVDPNDRRRKELHLTVKGQRLVGKLLTIWEA